MASGTTPVKAWPYPLETDTPDVAADMHSLALALDVVGKSTVGTLAQRPSSGMTAGDSHFVTGDATASNNNIEWVYSGGAWIAVNSFSIKSQAWRYTVNVGIAIVQNSGMSATMTLPVPYPDANYTAHVTMERGDTNTGPPFVAGVIGQSRTASQFQVLATNLGNTLAVGQNLIFHVTTTHD